MAESVKPCSVEQAIGIVGGKWKLYIIRVLLVSGPQRYNHLLAAVGGISPKVLTENLRALEHSGVITRIETQGVRVYSLTPTGQRLHPILRAMGEWAELHALSRAQPDDVLS